MNEWKTFTWEELSILASMQMSMHVRFRDRPPRAGSRKSRRFHEEVRKKVEAEWPKFSLQARQALLRSVQNGTLPDFLEQCGNELDARLDERDKQAGQLLAGWPAPEKHALLTFLSYRQWPESIVQDGALILPLEDEPTFSRTLSLLGVQGAPTGAEGRFSSLPPYEKKGIPTCLWVSGKRRRRKAIRFARRCVFRLPKQRCSARPTGPTPFP